MEMDTHTHTLTQHAHHTRNTHLARLLGHCPIKHLFCHEMVTVTGFQTDGEKAKLNVAHLRVGHSNVERAHTIISTNVECSSRNSDDRSAWNWPY